MDWAGTLAIGAAGGALFWLLGFPAAALTGSAAAVTLAAVLGWRTALPRRFQHVAFALLGVNIGSAVTPEVLATAASWPISISVLALALVIIIWVSRVLLERAFGFDRASAVLAASPGHLTYVIGYAADRDLDVTRITLAQSIRVLILTLAVPPLLTAFGETGNDFGLVSGPPMALSALTGLMLAGVVLGMVFLRARLPAAMLLAGMAVSAAGHLSGITPGSVPPPIAWAAFTVMGCVIGSRFRGMTGGTLRASLGAGLVITTVAAIVAVAATLILAPLLGLPPTLLLVAYAPGGVEAMAAMSVQLGLAPAFVAAHHVMRLAILTFLVPAMMPKASGEDRALH